MGRRGPVWTAEEIEIVRSHRHEHASDIAKLLPQRSLSAIQNVKYRQLDILDHGHAELPPVKPAGDYTETLGAPLVDNWECLSIWLKWNGYHAYRELSRDMNFGVFGVVTILCTAKE